MALETLQEQAARLGIISGDMSPTALIRRIQVRMGEEPCCGTDRRYLCRRTDCQWRAECQKLVAAWQR